MKSVYSFNLYKNQVFKTEKKDGDKVEVVEEVKKVPYKIILKKPSRQEIEEAQSVWAKEWSKAVNDGILTRNMLMKIYADKTNGFLSVGDSDYYNSLHSSLNELKNERIYLCAGKDGLKKNKNKINEIDDRISAVYRQIIEFESQKSEIFANTAENIAQSKTIAWLIVNLTYIQEEGKDIQPYFTGHSLEEKLDKHYDLLENRDDFTVQLLQKTALHWSFWYMRRDATKEEFDSLTESLSDIDL